MPTQSRRGVLGGAQTMTWKQRRAARIAQQTADRAARQQAQHESVEEVEEESDDDDAPAPARKKGTSMKSGARAVARSGWLPTMNGNRWTGAIIWLVGAYLTSQFLQQLGVGESVATPLGFVLQWILTRAESPLWRGNGYPRLALFATLIDGGINSGGAWPFMKNLGATDFWAMISDIAGTPGEPPTLITIVICSVAVGLATAAAAEYFWNL